MRGQVSLEFFLILGFCLAVLSVLISESEANISQNEKLDTAILSLSALNSVSNAVNTVALQGYGASMIVSVFVPQTAKCFILSPKNELSCDIGDVFDRRAYGMPLLTNPGTISTGCYTTSGWTAVTVNRSATEIGIYCQQQP
jgi:hypothetical protein